MCGEGRPAADGTLTGRPGEAANSDPLLTADAGPEALNSSGNTKPRASRRERFQDWATLSSAEHKPFIVKGRMDRWDAMGIEKSVYRR